MWHGASKRRYHHGVWQHHGEIALKISWHSVWRGIIGEAAYGEKRNGGSKHVRIYQTTTRNALVTNISDATMT